jgi:protein-S-isoprenylcysteine O-methyltransferase Ste14
MWFTFAFAFWFRVLLISTNWFLGLSVLFLVISIAAVRVPVEKRELGEPFGQAWETYRTRTGVMLPRRGNRLLHG